MKKTPWLSKSRIQSGRQCRKRLWLELHDPGAANWSSSAQARLDEGTRFGDLARELLGGGILIAADHRHVDDALAETTALLRKPYGEAPMLFEPAFSHAGVRVRVDAFQREGDRDTLIEVKSTTSVKTEHIWDCAIQTWVARGSNRNVTRVLHGHVDRSFVYRTEGNYQGLLKLVDITADVEALITHIPQIVEELKQVAVAPMPAIATGNSCFMPYECPFLPYCRGVEPPGPEFPVTLLPRAAALTQRLVDAGCRDLREVSDTELSNPIHLRIASATRTGEVFASEELKRLLAGIGYPRSFLDFETIAFVVPRWPGLTPFQQVPFQFSLHTQSHGGSLRHDAFLDTSGCSPVQGLVQALLSAIAPTGPVIVWNRGFEAARLRELAALCPEHSEALLGIVARMVDLLPIYRRHYYHPDMKGSWSLKAVLPTIAPDLDYHQLEVADGGDAQMAYLKACDAEIATDERDRLRELMLNYCERDTLAMVRLANAFVT